MIPVVKSINYIYSTPSYSRDICVMEKNKTRKLYTTTETVNKRNSTREKKTTVKLISAFTAIQTLTITFPTAAYANTVLVHM